MIRLPLHQLKPGMVLAMPLYGPDGVVLLNSGVTLKSAYIQRLHELGFSGAYVRDGVADDIPLDTPITEQTRAFAMAAVRQVVQELQQDSALPHLGKVRKAVNSILDDLLSHQGVMVGLTQVRATDDYTFAHSVDVGVMALIAGIAMGLSRPRLIDLGMGALLHDVGKTQVNRPILTKPGPLTPAESESMKLHTVYGFDMLRGRRDISAVAAHVAYEHHERNDGSGYPRGLREAKIHPLAQVVAVVDVFDAMTSDRPYRRGLPAHEAARYLTRTKGRLFSVVAVERFLARLPLYPTGTVVALNTGELALVIAQNSADRTRPVVRLLAAPGGRPFKRPVDIDLLTDRDRTITEISRWDPPLRG
ncbi:MAG: HD domain-containing phosphohydrolase [Bacillota bacterium]